jgi:hypothetical protein
MVVLQQSQWRKEDGASLCLDTHPVGSGLHNEAL